MPIVMQGKLALIVLLLFVCCAAPTRAGENALEVFTAEDRRVLEEGFHGALRYHPIFSEALDEPRSLLAPDELPYVYQVYQESGPEAIEMHRFVAISEVRGMSHLEYQLNATESQLLRVSDEQGVLIEGAIDRKEGVKTEFTPAKPLLPKALSPGQSLTAVTQVRVLDLAHPEKVRHSGELHLTLTHLGSFHGKVPSGDYDTILMRLESRGKIGPAEIDHRQYYFFAEDTGLVAFLESRRISAFAIYQKKEQKAWVLLHEGDSL